MSEDALRRELAYYKRHLDALAAEKIRNEHRQWVLAIQLRRIRQGFRLLSRLARSVGAQTQLGTMFRITAFAINAELGMDRTVVLVPAESPTRFRPAHFAGFETGAAERLMSTRFELASELQTGVGLMVVNRSTDETPLISAMRSAFGLPGFLCVPVRGDRGLIGLIFSGRLWEDSTLFPPLDQVDGDTFQAIAGVLEAAIQNTRLVLLEETHRLRSELFANVSHDFRTPLTLTLGPLAQILAGRWGALPEPIRERLRTVERSQGRMLGLIDEILELATLEAGATTFRPTLIRDVNEIVRECAGQFRPAAEARGIELRLSLDPVLAGADLFGERDKLERLLANLLSNAFKFTDEGYVGVATRCHANTLEIVVSDAGIGIAGEHLERIFDRFQQVHGSESRGPPGTGIGLALVKEIAHLHGGRVTVASEKGRGSRFTVTIPLGQSHLPVSEGSASREQATHSSCERRILAPSSPCDPGQVADARDAVDASNREQEAEFDLSRPVVLHVEDDADLRAYVRDVLDADYNVFAACDGVDGLDKARRYLPDLVLLDQTMPRMDGDQLLRALRDDRELHATPVIFLTARPGAEGRVESLEAGADDYVTKPFLEAELRARVKNLIKARAHERQLAGLNVELERRVREQMADLLRSGELKRFLPPSVADNLLRGRLDPRLGPEWRQVTMLTAEITRGLDAIAIARSNADALAEIVHEYFAEVTAVALAKAGTVESLSGGRVSILFGAPDPCEAKKSAEAALRVALEIRDRIVRLAAKARRRGMPTEWHGRIGVSTGGCVVGAFGGDLHRTYTAVGPAATAAASLLDEARPGAILCSESTWELARQHVKTREVARSPGAPGDAARRFEVLELAPPADEPTPAPPAPRPPRRANPDSDGRALRKEGDYWTVSYAGSVFRLRDSKGLHHLGHLLSRPGVDFHVLDLAGVPGGEDDAHTRPTPADQRDSGLHPAGPGDAGTILDDKAKAAYRARLQHLKDVLEEATRFADHARAARAQEEMTALAGQLAAAVGLGGRDRKAASVSERARINVTRTIKSAIDRIGARSANLGRHLHESIRTGIFCSYGPPNGAKDAWEVLP